MAHTTRMFWFSLMILGTLGLNSVGICRETVGSSVSAPAGYTKVSSPTAGFASTLRDIEIFPERVWIAGDGETVMCQENMVAVTDLKPYAHSSNVGVDGVLRLWGDYLWNHGDRSRISFPIDNGQVALWSDWSNGMRPKKKGGKYIFTQVTTPNGSRSEFEAYLAFVAEEMGAIALQRESEVVVDDSAAVGDLIVSYRANKQSWIGLILEICKNFNGDKLFLVGTSGAPASDFYIMRPYSPVQGVNEWFTLDGVKWEIGEGAQVYLRRVRLQ